MKEFFKKTIVVLLLMGFANMVTARPGCHFTSGSLADDADELRFNKTESFTVLEYMLETVHGLPDNIPNNEESGAHYSIFRVVVGSSRVDLQACKLEYSIVSPK